MGSGAQRKEMERTEATRNKCIATSNKCLTSRNKEAIRNKCLTTSNKNNLTKIVIIVVMIRSPQPAFVHGACQRAQTFAIQ